VKKRGGLIFIIMFPVLLSTVVMAGCSIYTVPTPEGFAEIEGQGRGKYLAVSPEGVRFSVRLVKNYPRQEMAFWQDAMSNYLTEAGYALLDGPHEFSGDQWTGVYFEWGAPYLGEDYIYFTGIIPSKDQIVVIEAAGAYDLYRKYSETILQTLKNIEVR
jgi:hypothetical protein